MTIGVLHVDMLVPGACSLKDKRRVLKSLKQLMHNRFNCSVAETEYQDIRGRAHLTVCVVSNDASHAHAQLTEIVRFASSKNGADLLDYQIEML